MKGIGINLKYLEIFSRFVRYSVEALYVFRSNLFLLVKDFK